MNGPQDMILKLPNGEVTSRVSVSLVEDTLKRCLAGEETGFELIPTRPIEGESRTFRSLSCQVRTETGSPPEVELMLTGEEESSALVLTADNRRAEDILRKWLRREAPELTGYPGGEYLPGGPEWKNITKQMKKRK